jgi:hypothetical protein
MGKELNYRITLTDFFSNKMNTLIGKTQELDRKTSDMGSTIINAFGIAAVIAFGKSIIDVGTQFSNAEIQLTTALGSASEAHKTFLDIQAESIKSPFNFDQILQGNAMLISAGESATQAKDHFNDLATALAANGKVGGDELARMAQNMVQIKNNGFAAAPDVKQFGFAGIPIFQLLDDYSKKTGKVLKEEKISYEDITGALQLAGAEGGRYFGAQERLAESTAGKISNLSDAWKILQYNIFVAFEPEIKKTVSYITKFFNLIKENIDWIKPLVIAFFDAFVFISIIKGLASIGTALTGLNTLMIGLAATNPWLLAIAGAATLYAAITQIQNTEFFKQNFKSGGNNKQDNVNYGSEFGEGGDQRYTKAIKPLMQLFGGNTNFADALPKWLRNTQPFSMLDYGKGKIKPDNKPEAPKTQVRENITINITKLVESLNLSTVTLKEGTAEIKTIIGLALQEAVSSVRYNY